MGGVISKGSGSAAPPARTHSAPRRSGKDGAALLGEVLSAAIATGFLVWGLKITLSYMDPYREGRKEAKRQAALLKQRLGRNIELNEFELLLASSVLNPSSIDVKLDDIGGLEHVKDEMRLKVLKPLSEPGTFCTTLWRPVKGVLFYGPPGTGKTMLAKALAAESSCYFLNVTASSVMSKWYGDANRFIRAIFTLATKLQPCVVFIDEVDAFLTKRGAQSEHEATLQAKTEFMQLWDGMEGARGSRVLVMGATNRPWMVDEAVLRRFALQYEIGLPTHEERVSIMRNYLLRHQADTMMLQRAGRLAEGEGGVDLDLLCNQPIKSQQQPSSSSTSAGSKGTAAAAPRGRCLDAVAAATEGYSGSDLMELAAQAAQNVLVEHWHTDPEGKQKLRQLNMHDMLAAAESCRPGVTRAEEYSMQNLRSSSSHFDGSSGSNGGAAANAAGMAQLMAAAAAAAAAKRGSSAGGGAGAAAKGSSGGSAAGNGAAAAADASTAGDAAQDEVYKMVGKMVLNSLSWQQ